MFHQLVGCVQEAVADNQMKCEAVCAVGRLLAFQSLAAGDWLAPQLVSHMVSHGKEVCHCTPCVTHPLHLHFIIPSAPSLSLNI